MLAKKEEEKRQKEIKRQEQAEKRRKQAEVLLSLTLSFWEQIYVFEHDYMLCIFDLIGVIEILF